MMLIKYKLMKITSIVFENNQPIPAKYTCQGENINPPLSFSEVPPATQSLTLIVDDPDAPGTTWVHWVLFNIPPNTQAISENSIPSAALQGLTDFGTSTYGGPCPPSGTHRYFFKLYALDISLNLTEKAKKEDIEKAMKDHILAKTELIGLYKKI